MIKFYYHPSPNPDKVALFLEEAGLPYELVPVDTRKGEQHQPAFLAINPNAKKPAKFLSADTPAARGQLLSWLMFVATGIGPYSGQAVHFKHFAPEKSAYAINRYDYEAWRHWEIINNHL